MSQHRLLADLKNELADLKQMWNEELAIRYREEYGLTGPAEALEQIDELTNREKAGPE